MNIRGEVSMIIFDNDFDFGEIRKKMKPNVVRKKGEYISSAIGRKLEYNIFQYELEFTEPKELEKSLKEFSKTMENNIELINEVIEQCNRVEINLYIRSDYSQIGFVLPKEFIKSIAKLEMDINYHVMSFGLVDSDTTR